MIRRLCTSLPRVAGAFDAAQLQPASLLCHAVECTQQPANMRSFVAVAWRTRHWTSIPASGTARPMATTSTADDSEQTNTPEQTSHSTQPADTPAPFYLKRRNHKRRMEARAEQRREAHARRKMEKRAAYERKRAKQIELWQWKTAAWAEYRAHKAAAASVDVSVSDLPTEHTSSSSSRV